MGKMNAKQKLVRLVRLQELANRTRDARAVVEGAPGRIEEIESRFRERNAEYVALRDRHDELDKDQRTRSGELTTLEESRKKYMNDLMQVTNQREYSAMLKEIDAIKAQISEHEDAILKAMEETETLKGDLAKFAEHIEKEREQVGKERTEVEAMVEQAMQTIERWEQERARIGAELPASLVDAVRRLEESRQGLFLVKAEDGICQACFVRARPQAYQEIRLATAIHNCGNCKRFLYHEPSIEAALAEFAEASDDGGTEGGEISDGSTAVTGAAETAPPAETAGPATDAGVGG